jgi:hypothetical protein
MDVFMLMVKDPVVWGSLLVIGATCVMAGYYTYLFLTDQDNKHH